MQTRMSSMAFVMAAASHGAKLASADMGGFGRNMGGGLSGDDLLATAEPAAHGARATPGIDATPSPAGRGVGPPGIRDRAAGHLCSPAYGFLISQREKIPLSAVV